MYRRTVLLGVGGTLIAACAPRARSEPSPPRADLYRCEGCEGVFDRPLAGMAARSRIAPPGEPGAALTVTGTVFQADGVTPASGVAIYAYHTNDAGLYANGTPETEASRRHGRLRGWVRTGDDGRYVFDTIKPAPYPDDTIPAHLHFTMLEAGRQPYWIDDIVFAGEFGVTPAYAASMTDKGGNGIVPLRGSRAAGFHLVRDIVLERHPT